VAAGRVDKKNSIIIPENNAAPEKSWIKIEAFSKSMEDVCPQPSSVSG
jgi:hypothetical protein